MTHKKSNVSQLKVKRKKYSPQFKEQAVERTKKDGVAKVAKDLGIHESALYNWRKELEKTGIPFEDQKIREYPPNNPTYHNPQQISNTGVAGKSYFQDGGLVGKPILRAI